MLNKKDTYRGYGIWVILILFYIGFYYLSNYAWINEIDIDPNDEVIPSQFAPSPYSHRTDTMYKLSSTDSNNLTNKRIHKKSIKIKSVNSLFKPTQKSYRKKIIQINKAHKDDWELLYNIGPYRAERILKFRSALGGFYSIDQVGETYGLPDSVFQQIKPQLKVDTGTVLETIKLHTMPYDSLYRHPYITKQMAYFIVKNREKGQVFYNLDDLYTIIKEKDHKRLRKLEPYLDFGIK